MKNLYWINAILLFFLGIDGLINLGANENIAWFQYFVFITFIVGALISVGAVFEREKNILQNFLLFPALIMFFYQFQKWQTANFIPEEMLEHFSQLLLPLLCFFGGKLRFDLLVKFLKISIACTFLGHGLYALSWHDVPESFLHMVESILKLDKKQALTFLKVVGLIDVFLAVLLFLPKATKYTLLYMIVWGAITALARTAYVLFDGGDIYSVFAYLPSSLFRFPNFLIPVFLLHVYSSINSENKVQYV